jgi:formylglycine-generating enzyme required for sulfatase activity
MTPQHGPGRELFGLAVAVAALSCDSVLGIQQYGPGLQGDGEAPAADASSDRSDTGTDATSCARGGAGMTSCGPGGNGNASCCNSPEVPGGTFDRSYDAVTYTDSSNPATVHTFRLDQFEITVGRFRQFVTAVVNGWTPPSGSGKHAHLNGGNGLAATGGGYETGWDATNWNAQLATTLAGWNSNLACDDTYAPWTPSAGANESKPIGCVTWYEAYAFCIWDGGFLPSEAEWNDAAAGGGAGGGQRAYPWSVPPTSTTIDCTYANFNDSVCTIGELNDVGSESPLGDGAFGQSDMAGNVREWALDWFASTYVSPCTDCANLTLASTRVLRGGGFFDLAMNVLASARNGGPPNSRSGSLGARCARSP